MFRKSDPQPNLFGVETHLPDNLQYRLKATWAYLFRFEVLPIPMRVEEALSDLYGITGRPNFKVVYFGKTLNLVSFES